MDQNIDHLPWLVNKHHNRFKKLQRRNDHLLNSKAINPLLVFSAVLGFQTARIVLGMYICVYNQMIQAFKKI